MSIPLSRICKNMLAGTAAAALLLGGAAGIDVQAAAPTSYPPLPQPRDAQPTTMPATGQPAMALGHDDVREVQNQLISLGFDPGPADGEAGPGTMAAVQKYDQSRGGPGRVSIDSALLARLKADTGIRLTYEQVAERSRARQQAQAAAPAGASNQMGASNQLGGIVQQIVPLIGAAIANSNNNNNNNYGPGYYGPGPGYYGPPGYYSRGYGGF
jgi:peptidoglycan hydrolase-like protein with peptidoglycan-binding domain